MEVAGCRNTVECNTPGAEDSSESAMGAGEEQVTISIAHQLASGAGGTLDAVHEETAVVVDTGQTHTTMTPAGPNVHQGSGGAEGGGSGASSSCEAGRESMNESRARLPD